MYLTQSLHRAVQRDPDRIATVFGDRTRTYAQSADRVARLAGGLRALGVGGGDRVGVLALNSDLYLECLLATCWADAVINTVNTRWSTAEIAASLVDCQTTVLFVGDDFLHLVEPLRDRCPQLAHVIHLATTPADGVLGHEQLITDNEPVPDARRGGDSLAALFYTGGTTGRSKGVMLSHANLMTSTFGSMASCTFATPGGAFLHSAPMFHLADLTGWLAHLALGNTQVVIPRFDPADFLRAVQAHAVTDVLLVATMIQLVIDHPQAAETDLSSLRRMIYGAAPISDAVLRRTMERIPQLELVQTYGMTELSPVATILTPEQHRPGSPRLRTVGVPALHSELRIVDGDDRDVPPGVVGEITVRGGHVMLGYWNQPDETAEALRGGWMHTGDGGYLDEDGYLSLVDRVKDMIITGGENVYSTEVENALHQHPAVATCAVIGIPDDTYGEAVHAVVVLRQGAHVTAAELRTFAKSLVAGYKAPRSVSFVDELPTSAAGKILKRELRARYADAGAPMTP
ncbi:long-chain fatty acid--CoA ligase [Pseudonocardia sp. C8]|uniref:acyl-CoA synthetase n=1 Tax=Pseudonocardia sp. C8 TaxID=2762759 RepID=UPI0016434783|nr:long-chain fatty acid--CoA ligase [Pseudonocardia sp. C8]MBC3191847.1 long-chain fatty acid--CoA ligase [Pseudonocardia sp. C8]